MKSGYQCCGGPIHSRVRYEWACGCWVEHDKCMHAGSLGFGSGGPLVCIVDHTDDVIKRPSSVTRDPFFARYLWTQYFPDYSQPADINGKRPGEWKTMQEFFGPVTR